MLTEVNAFRTDGLITVELIGQSPTPWDEVLIVASYPGTNSYLGEPCSAKIFISEGRKPDFENISCLQRVGKIWSLNRIIRDKYSKSVEIFINGYLVRKKRVRELTFIGMYKF